MRNKMIVNEKENLYNVGVYCMKSKSGIARYIGTAMMNDALSRHLHFLKRAMYYDTNKAILNDLYDKEELVFEPLHVSVSNEEYMNMNDKEKDALNKALSVLEEMYMNLYRTTICNSQKTVHRHSSNRNKQSTIRRRKANLGVKNPNRKYDEKIIQEILWLKMNGYKPKQISEYYKDIKKSYIGALGVTKWIHLEPVKPKFLVG